MISIPAAPMAWPDGTSGLAPSTPPPADAVQVAFDGTTNTYTVYEPGDTLPAPAAGT